MNVRVRLFATLRQQAGWAQQSIELPDGATLADALAAVDRAVPTLNLPRRTVYVAVNQEYARGAQVLREGDEVAIFPPVSGGQWRPCGVQEPGGAGVSPAAEQGTSAPDARTPQVSRSCPISQEH